MTDERIIEEMAKLEHHNIVGVQEGFAEYLIDGQVKYSPFHTDYLDNHNACQQMIDGFDDETMEKYIDHITFDSYEACLPYVLKLTPRQKCEAILKATGKWEE